jgi:hypothetical protein
VTTPNITSGFIQTGILPFKPDILTDGVLAAEFFTNRPVPIHSRNDPQEIEVLKEQASLG